ncbi:MAG: adenylyltransferase/cytidyltransferase family protein [Sulfitobacter sp.]|nr:adenylyltransferase/cytidyltransferase family protein [Sulfitobacter sp.]
MRIMPRAPRVVLTYGRFDEFHQGHVNFLRQANQLGEELIVGCTTDDYAVAGAHPCAQNFDDRRAILQSCRFVSRVIPHNNSAQMRTDIVNYNVCTLVMGTEYVGEMDDMQDIAQILYLPRKMPMPKGRRRTEILQLSAFG